MVHYNISFWKPTWLTCILQCLLFTTGDEHYHFSLASSPAPNTISSSRWSFWSASTETREQLFKSALPLSILLLLLQTSQRAYARQSTSIVIVLAGPVQYAISTYRLLTHTLRLSQLQQHDHDACSHEHYHSYSNSGYHFWPPWSYKLSQQIQLGGFRLLVVLYLFFG